MWKCDLIVHCIIEIYLKSTYIHFSYLLPDFESGYLQDYLNNLEPILNKDRK